MELQELVSTYKLNPSSKLKGQIVTDSLPLIKSILGKIKHPNNPLCETDDLIDIGSIGLLQALESYTIDKDVKFNTFAYYRIRGNIIDYLRSIDELSRTNRTRYGVAKDAISYLQQRLGRLPSDLEVANEIKLDIKDYRKLLSHVQQRVSLSLDFDATPGNDSSLANRIPDEDFILPDHDMLDEESSEQLRSAVLNLAERERLILALYYYEDYNLKEIADTLDLSEARISQIMGRMLITLRSSLKEYVLA